MLACVTSFGSRCPTLNFRNDADRLLSSALWRRSVGVDRLRSRLTANSGVEGVDVNRERYMPEVIHDLARFSISRQNGRSVVIIVPPDV